MNILKFHLKWKNGRIIIDATINQRKGKFVFDTGSTESYLDIKVNNLRRAGYTITQYEGQPFATNYYSLNKIMFGDIKVKTRSYVINRSDVLTRCQNEGYNGILGALTFEGYWCELSFSKSKIILHKEKPDYFTKHSEVMILNKYNTDFFIPVKIDNEMFYFDIDTGAPAGLYFPDGLIRIKNRDEYQEVISNDPVDTYHLVKTGSITILDETYTDMSVMTNSPYSARADKAYHDFGLLGIDFLKNYDFLFDFRDLREGKSTGLYFKPILPVNKRNYGVYSFIHCCPVES